MAQYTVQRIRAKTNDLYGAVHGSDDADHTFCGIEMDWKTYILSSSGDKDEDITCKMCLGIMKNRVRE